MKEIFQHLSKVFEKNEAAVLVTVTSSSGSTPRGEGAHMLVSKAGRLTGTIGGGAVEYHAEEIAKKALKKHSAHMEKFILAPNKNVDLGMICGGNVEVSFHYLSGEDPINQQLCTEVNDHYAKNQQGWLVLEIEPDNTNHIGFYSEATGLIGSVTSELPTVDFEAGTKIIKMNQHTYWIESLLQKGKVYVFGSGHVAQALVPVLTNLNFYCVVLDDRPEFLTKEHFPTADERIIVDLTNFEQQIQLTADDYGVIMTRSHRFDFEAARQLLQMPAYYLGLMGSKRKVANQISRLKEYGYSDEEIKKIHMPIGLEINGETPAELAISVAGQLIMERAANR
jgi:xanthine dehydrogenase accessory factor